MNRSIPERFSVLSDVRFRAVLDEGVVVRQRGGEVLVVNEVAIRTLELLAEGNGLAEIAETLSEEFEVSAKQAGADARSFAQELIEAGVIEPARDSNA